MGGFLAPWHKEILFMEINMEDRTLLVNFKVSPKEKKQMEQNAYKAGLTLSAYIRLLALKGLGA